MYNNHLLSFLCTGVQLYLRRLFEALSCGPTDQAPSAGVHHSHPPLDLHTVLQGAALRLSAHCYALLHLRHHWHAGKWIAQRLLTDICMCLLINFMCDAECADDCRLPVCSRAFACHSCCCCCCECFKRCLLFCIL